MNEDKSLLTLINELRLVLTYYYDDRPGNETDNRSIIVLLKQMVVILERLAIK